MRKIISKVFENSLLIVTFLYAISQVIELWLEYQWWTILLMPMLIAFGVVIGFTLLYLMYIANNIYNKFTSKHSDYESEDKTND